VRYRPAGERQVLRRMRCSRRCFERYGRVKQVTLLFADVVPSMDIAAAVDIERLREIMTALVERSSMVARQYSGTVEYHGDGIMAIFGAPTALEDHAFRACGAATAGRPEFGPGDRR